MKITTSTGETVEINGNEEAVDTNEVVDTTIESTEDTTEVVEDKVTPTEEVVESTDEVVEDEAFVIDDIEYKLDKEGNAVNDKGEIVHTKEQIESYTSEDDSIVRYLGDKYDMDTSEYNESQEGVYAFTNDLIGKVEQESKSKAISELTSTFPALSDVITHLKLNNGDMSNYNAKVDYNALELDKNNESQLANIIVSDFVDKGFSQADANDMVRMFRENNTLFEQASKSKANLEATQETERIKEAENVKAIEAAEKQEFVNYWGIEYDDKGVAVATKGEDTVYDLIVNRHAIKVKDTNFTIPNSIVINKDGKKTTKSPKDLFNYMFNTVPYKLEDGSTVNVTEYQIAKAKQDSAKTKHDTIFDAYKLFTNGSMLISSKAATTSTNKKSLKRYVTKTAITKQRPKSDKIVPTQVGQ